jgi:hypothetical protein
MSRALLTVAFFACFAAAAPASVKVRAPDAVSETVARRPLQPAGEPAMVVVAGIAPERPGVPPSPVANRSSKEEDGWRSYGTLLATLVLMAAIALRRHRSGGP